MIYYSPHRKAHRRWRSPVRLCRTTVAVQFLLLVTVFVIVCGLLRSTDMGTALLSSSGQKNMDIHTDPQADGGAEEQEESHNVDEGQTGKNHTEEYEYKYITLTGYFIQDDPLTDAAQFNFLTTNFGLIDRFYDSDPSLPNNGADLSQWKRFEHHISSLNRNAQNPGEEAAGAASGYVLFFLARHGNGYHNIAERYYGSVAWDCHFSALDGDPEGIMVWSDAHLSKEGQRQAREVNAFWKSQTSAQNGGQNMSLPELYLVSPLDRTLETARLSFKDLGPRTDGEIDAVVVEKIREGTGIHTCDRRSGLQYIREHFPTYNVDLDPHLGEEDEFWFADKREPETALTARLQSFFDELFSSHDIMGENVERVSITSHSGAIGAMMRVLGHRQFSLGTGAVIPVFVKVDRIPIAQTKNLQRRHGGDGEGKGHKDPVLDLPDLEESQPPDSSSAQDEDPNDKSKWEDIPSCPADMDLNKVGYKRWGMGLKEFLDGVEDGSVKVDEVAFRFTE